LQLCHKKC